MKRYCLNGLVFLILVGFTSCDPAYEYFIEAKSEDIIVVAHPSLESIYCPNLKEVCDRVTSHRINNKIDSPMYRIRSGEKFSFYGGVGTQASINSFPFDFVKIIRGSDTLLLKDKSQILKKFVRDKNSNKYYLNL